MLSPQPASTDAEKYTRHSFEAFRVLPWELDGATVRLRYSLDDELSFTETITYPSVIDLSIPGVSAALDLLSAVAGVSYFKVASPLRIHFEGTPFSVDSIQLFRRLYDEGLREYAYRNGLPVPFETTFANTSAEWRPFLTWPIPRPEALGRLLLPMGGGRDSGLLASLLRHRGPTLMSVGANSYVERLADALGLSYFRVTRSLSPNIGELNRGRGLNGHVPVTAINSLVSVVAALLTDHERVVMANESSASSPTITLPDGCEINHQFSKSLEVELSMNAALTCAGVPIHYFSALRAYGELAIARAFATKPELFPLIMSCNRAFLRDAAQRSDGWCGQCAKCRFVFLTLAPFSTPAQLTTMFGHDLLNSSSLVDQAGFADLLSDERPFDCVGEVSEARLAVGLLANTPEWATHPIVVHLAGLVAPLDRVSLAAALATGLAAHPNHAVPADILADVSVAFQ